MSTTSSSDPWAPYQRLKVVGRGAHGFAILCRRKKDSAMLVIKELFDAQGQEAEDSQNEIKMLTIVRHPHIISYLDSFTAEAKEEYEIQEESEKMGARNGESQNAVGDTSDSSTVAKIGLPEKPLTLYIVMEYADGMSSLIKLQPINTTKPK